MRNKYKNSSSKRREKLRKNLKANREAEVG